MTKTNIMMAGHFARDLLVGGDDQAETSSVGGIYYGGIAFRRLGVSVAVMTRLHFDDFSDLDEITTIVGEILRITNSFHKH